MLFRILFILVFSLVSGSLFAADSLYCPQNGGYVKIGMTVDQVVKACGQPISKQESDQPLFVKVPVQQLLYFKQSPNQDIPDYQYNIKINTVFGLDRGQTGVALQVDIVNNKVDSILLNSSGKNAMNLCGGTDIQPGDEVGKVYFACGTPSAINTTFMRKAVRSTNKPQIWLYQPSSFAPTVSLTFVDGTLQSIN